MNNIENYTAAYAGCIGGAAQRIFTSTEQTDYDAFINAAKMFALAVDAKIPGVTTGGVFILGQLCQGYWTTRFPQGQTQADYDDHVDAIVAIYNVAINFAP